MGFFSLHIPKLPDVDKLINVRNNIYYPISKNNKQFSLEYSVYYILPVPADSDCTEEISLFSLAGEW